MDAAAWDARYRSAPLVWSAGPNALFAELTADLPAGRALDLAAGEGRNAIWLAGRGWRVTALDFSTVALDKARQRAASAAVDVTWVAADVTATDLGRAAYDLVSVLYLHLPPADLRDVLARAAAAVAPGGTLLVLGHDRDNLARGTGGPQDRALLYTAEDLAPAAAGLRIVRLAQVDRRVDEAVAVDTLLLAVHPGVDRR